MQLNKLYTEICKSSMITPAGITEFTNMCTVLNDQVHNLDLCRIFFKFIVRIDSHVVCLVFLYNQKIKQNLERVLY